MSGLPLWWLEGELAVCRLEPGAVVAESLLEGPLAGVTRTAEETSLLCSYDRAPEGSRVEGPFVAFGVEGPLDFSLTGILAELSRALAEAEISIFALSTFDTDYVLVPAARRRDATVALEAAGHRFAAGAPRSS